MSDNSVCAVNSTEPGDVVSFTQHVRYRMFDELTSNGTNLTAEFDKVHQLLNSMDSAALTTRKLDIEAKEADNGAQILRAHRELANMLGGRDPFLKQADAPLPIAERVTAVDHDAGRLPLIELLPGEDAQYEQPLSINDYVQSEE